VDIRAKDIGGFIIASRIPNLIIIAYTQFAAAWFLMNIPRYEILNLSFAIFLISTAMIGAGGYIINDYFDQKIDMINRPQKVVVGTDLRRRFALLFHVLLSFGGILLGFFIDPMIGAIHVFSAGALWTYSVGIKKVLLLSTLTISFLTCLTILLVMVYFRDFSLVAVAYALFGCVVVFIRETLKDIISAKGERIFGVQSVPIVWGIRGAKLLIFLACIAGISILFYYLWSVPNWTVRYYFIAVLVIALWFFYKLIKADKKDDFRKMKIFTDFIIVSGLASMILV
jgi:4-hydroxybenzoate polyprenyltransferase